MPALFWSQASGLVVVGLYGNRERMEPVGSMPIQIPVDRTAIADFCRRHGIRELSLFGSVLRDDFRPNSDVDVLVEFLPGSRIGLFEFCGMIEELETIFGKKVDLMTMSGLHPRIRDKVLASREVLYSVEG
jgi:predicted nucleotidyltransferase